MSEYGRRAVELFDEGYNCAQSVAGAFAERFGIPLNTMTKLASGFGGGVAGRRELCGAVSGMIMAIGLGCGYSDSSATDEKQAHYARCRGAMEKFEKEAGSLICSELLALQKGNAPGVRPCRTFCEIAADIADEVIGE